MLELDAEEARVTASLAEKQLTTPQYYPLTLNALVSACNQSNNRDPVVSYDQATVEEALGRLRAKGVGRVIHAGGGNRTVKYRHVLDEVLGLDRRELAIVTVLLLRGPQTLNEVRTRTERMADFDDTAAVERDLVRLSEREEPLVVRLERQAGRKEARYAALLTPLPAVAPPAPAGHPEARAGARERRGRGRPGAPRLAPLDRGRLAPDEAALLDEVTRPAATNLLTTLLRHPDLARRWRPLSRALLDGVLPARLRELAILRTAWRTGSDYQWAQHAALAADAGLGEEEVRAVAEPVPSGGWDEVEAAVLRAADELHADACIADATWATLASDLDERQLIELVFVVGHWQMIAFALNSLGVQPEPGLAATPVPPPA